MQGEEGGRLEDSAGFLIGPDGSGPLVSGLSSAATVSIPCRKTTFLLHYHQKDLKKAIRQLRDPSQPMFVDLQSYPCEVGSRASTIRILPSVTVLSRRWHGS